MRAMKNDPFSACSKSAYRQAQVKVSHERLDWQSFLTGADAASERSGTLEGERKSPGGYLCRDEVPDAED